MTIRGILRILWITSFVFAIICGFLLFGNIIVKEHEDSAKIVFSAFIGAAFSAFIPWLVATFVEYPMCKYRDVSCIYKKNNDELGLETVYASMDDGQYIADITEELEAVRYNRRHTTFNDSIILLGVSLRAFFLRDGAIRDATLALPKETFIKIFTCHPENKELKWREERAKTVGGDIRLDGTTHSIHDLEKDLPIWMEGRDGKVLWNNERKTITTSATPFEDCFPSATICIINDYIFFTPSIVDFDNYIVPDNPQQKKSGSLSFKIKRDSPFGKRLLYLFKHVYVLDEDHCHE